MDDLTQINTFSRNEVYRLYRESGRSPRLAKHEEAEESIIKSEYSPHTAFANALNVYSECYILPFVDSALERISEIRQENRSALSASCIKEVESVFQDIVIELWPKALSNAYRVATSHMFESYGYLFDYKVEELQRHRDKLAQNQPTLLLEIVFDKINKAAVDTNTRIRKRGYEEMGEMRGHPSNTYIIKNVKNLNSMDGDQINNSGSGNTVVNRSTVQNAFNKVAANYDDETANAIKVVAGEINRAGNKEAAENFEAFNEELLKPQPKKTLLKSLWEGTLSALPSLAQLSSVVNLIMRLFS